MSESHDIEQIARERARLIAETLYDSPDPGGPCSEGSWLADMRELVEAIEKGFLPLISAAEDKGRLEGAKEWKSLAVVTVEDAHIADSYTYTEAAIVERRDRELAAMLRALPLKEPA